ncbi:MAG: RNA pseudouridine synthase [Spirochaetes bacterium]|nr:RNA pseudouridine synthase [Spirochaetota bacterium]
MQVEFIYEDDDIIVVDKPSGLPVIAPDGGRGHSVYGFVTARIQRTNPRGRAAVIHRIDRDTSGIVVFGKNAAAKRSLMGGWHDLAVSRTYLAVVEGIVADDDGEIVSYLVENRAGTVYECRPDTRGALRAVTRWWLIEAGSGYSFLELELETGRKHQIRVQLAAIGHPVAGDGRYGARTDPLGRLCLHAASIELAKTKGGETLLFESPPPDGFARLVRGS